MSKRICCQLAIGAFLGGTMTSIVHTTNIFHLSFCSSEINHFFCDTSPLFSLSCTDTYIHDVVLVVFASLVGARCLLTVLLSYILTIAAILKTGSAEGRRKGFSTVRPIWPWSLSTMVPWSSFICALALSIQWLLIKWPLCSTPTLNPWIYSLRKKYAKNAFRKMISRKFLS